MATVAARSAWVGRPPAAISWFSATHGWNDVPVPARKRSSTARVLVATWPMVWPFSVGTGPPPAAGPVLGARDPGWFVM
ncbi:MAG: hypothetical protein ABW328_04480, partial [Ilumatobacteraceae bacterium]